MRAGVREQESELHREQSRRGGDCGDPVTSPGDIVTTRATLTLAWQCIGHCKEHFKDILRSLHVLQ